jgi:hypothetical protein
MADTSTNSWKLLYETGRQALQSRKLQEAEQSFSAALQLAEDFPAGDPRLAATLNALARIYSLQRRYLAAAALLNRLLEVTERTLGPTHVQVAGVLTNLAEMYTHLGAAREELELRERVLAIRRDDPTADAALVQRVEERVAELRSAIEAQDAPEADDEIEPLPVVRTAEYTAPIAMVNDRAAPSMTTSAEHTLPAITTPAEVAPVSGSTAVKTRSPLPSLPPVQRVTPAMAPLSILGSDHGFADMGRDEYQPPATTRRLGGRSSWIPIAAGLVLVAGLLAARNSVAGPDDERESTGSVNLANVAAPTAPAAATPAAPATVVEPRTVEHLVAERRAESKRAGETSDREATRSESRERSATPALPGKLPSGAALERALRSVDGAVKVIDQRTRAATDSATGLRLETPTFNSKVRMSETVVSRPQER